MDTIPRHIIRAHYYDKDYYMTTINDMKLSYDFFYADMTIFNVEMLVEYTRLDERIVDYILDYNLYDRYRVLTMQQLSNIKIRNILLSDDDTDIKYVQKFQTIPCNLIQQFIHKLDMKLLCANQYLDLRLLIDNRNVIVWSELMSNQKMLPVINEGFIMLFHEFNIWSYVGNTDIPLDILLKYKSFFTKKTYKDLRKKYGTIPELEKK